jgi:MFS family permease
VTTARRQLGLLGRAPGYRLLFFATLASSFGTLLALLALAVDVKDRTDSGVWVSALMLGQFLPSVAVGLLAGPFIDRLPRKGLMIVSDLVRAAIFCALPFVGSPAAIVVLASLAGFATGFFRPAVYAGLPNLVSAEDLPSANGLLQAVENVSWTVAPPIAGLIVAASGPSAAYWVNAASFLVSAALILGIARRLLQSTEALSRGHWRDLADGMRFVLGARPLLTVLVAWTIGTAGIALVDVGEPFLAKDTFSAGDFGYGLMFGSIGLGLALGSLGVALSLERRPVGSVYSGAIAVAGLGYGLAAVSPNVWVASACCVVGGIGNGGANVCNALLVQRGAPDELRGRAFTVIMSTNYLFFGIGFVVAGLMRDAIGPRWVWATAGLLFAVASVAAWALSHGERSEVEEPPESQPGQAVA